MIRYLDGRQVTDAAGVTLGGIAGNKLVLAALAVSAFVIVIAVVYYSRMA
jgi:hypothetical protein